MIVGIFDAKTHFSHLIERIEAGEEITITRHGVAVAKLVPVRTDRAIAIRRLGEQMKAARKGRTLGVPARRVIEEGRR